MFTPILQSLSSDGPESQPSQGIQKVCYVRTLKDPFGTQLILVTEEGAEKPEGPEYRHGLTPPMREARRQRFRSEPEYDVGGHPLSFVESLGILGPVHERSAAANLYARTALIAEATQVSLGITLLQNFLCVSTKCHHTLFDWNVTFGVFAATAADCSA